MKMTAKEVAKHFGVTQQTVALWAREGAPFEGMVRNRATRNPTRLFDLEKLQIWIDQQYGTEQPGKGE